MDDIPVQGGGGNFRFSVGPASASATGTTVVNVLLAILIIGTMWSVIYVLNQQTILLTSQHEYIRSQIAINASLINNLTRVNENVFLSAMLPNEKKKELPSYIQDRAREIVERRAENITDNRMSEPNRRNQ